MSSREMWEELKEMTRKQADEKHDVIAGCMLIWMLNIEAKYACKSLEEAGY